MKRADFAKNHLLKRSVLSYLLYPASLCYAGLMLLRRIHLRGKGYRAPFVTISVGNLTSGGSGKSPIAIAICKKLHDMGISCAYASRGYKSKLEHSVSIVSDGATIFYPASEAGDEAVMASEMLPGIPVLCGRKRNKIIQTAANEFPNLQVMVLDDAFQHLKVFRDLDIVVFDTDTALGNGFVIPAGYLRESLSAIDASCICLLHNKPGSQDNPSLERTLRQRGAQVYHVYSRPSIIRHLGNPVDKLHLADDPFSLISAIAHPASFENSVRELELKFDKHLIFPDHYPFQDAEIRNKLMTNPAKRFLCTAKDAGKLAEIFGDRLYVLELETSLPDELINRISSLIR